VFAGFKPLTQETPLNFLTQHATLISLVGAYVFLAVVGSLPEPGDPRPISQKLYDTFYKTVHLLANKVVERKPDLALPGVK
jgi:hypothetical protein